MFFLHKKHLPQRNLYTQTAHRSFYRPTFWHAETLPRAVFTQQKLFRTEAFTQKTKKYAQQFSQTDGFYTESSPHRSLTHRRFYAQHFLHTDAFTHRCLYTDTNCTQKLVHTARVYTLAQILHREALLPLLDHLPFVFPLSSCLTR